MIKIKKAVALAKLDMELQDILRDIRKHEGIINSIKVEASYKTFSKAMLRKLIKKRQELSDLITETVFLDG